MNASRLELLTGSKSSDPYPPAITSETGDGKFTPDGKVLGFPGNTFLCHINQESVAFKALCAIQNEVKSGPCSEYFAYLPPESFHMTVFPSVCGNPLGYDGFPVGFDQSTSLDEITAVYAKRLEEVTTFSSCAISAKEPTAGYELRVDGASETDRSTLWRVRNVLQDLTGLHRPDFAEYKFHITLAYRLKWMPEKIALSHIQHMDSVFENVQNKLANIQLGHVEFCMFKDMRNFASAV